MLEQRQISKKYQHERYSLDRNLTRQQAGESLWPVTSLSIAPGGGPGKSCTGWIHCGCIVAALWVHCDGCKAWPPQYSLLRVRLMFKDASGDNPPPVASIQGGLSLSLDWVVIGGCSSLKKSIPCHIGEENSVVPR